MGNSRIEKVRQNLVDAGCNTKTITDFFALGETESLDQQLTLLRRHRRTLLEMLHKQQREIDCLDYLIVELKEKSAEK